MSESQPSAKPPLSLNLERKFKPKLQGAVRRYNAMHGTDTSPSPQSLQLGKLETVRLKNQASEASMAYFSSSSADGLLSEDDQVSSSYDEKTVSKVCNILAAPCHEQNTSNNDSDSSSSSSVTANGESDEESDKEPAFAPASKSFS